MNRIVLRSKVDSDGVLRIAVPVGKHEADHEMQVIVEPAPSFQESTQEWSEWIASIAGKWQGEFERPPQGEFEEREPLS